VCGIKGFETGALANAISIVQYDLRNLETHSNFGSANTDYAPLYSADAIGPFDESRTELVRVELDTAGNPIAGTEELVAEYAVDFKLGITVAQPSVTGPTLKTVLSTDTDDEVDNWAGDPSGKAAGVNRGPHLVRSVRVRLSVRSREADRDGDVIANAHVAPGLYRIALGPDGTAPFARVRTLQADIALRNQMKALWP
jgi:hypothetical protein